MPDEAEALGLLALMLLNDSRRAARFHNGELVLLDDQDRSLWNEAQIGEAARCLRERLHCRATAPASLGRDRRPPPRTAPRLALRRLGRNAEARDAYARALQLTLTDPERRFLEGRLLELRPRSQAEWDEFWTHTLADLKKRIERDAGESDRS
jgi:predicted RNA polymerase sigma factor